MPPGPGVLSRRRAAAVWCIQVNTVGSPVRHLRVTARIKIQASCQFATFARAKAQFGLLWPPGRHSAGWDGHFPTQMHPPSGLGASERRTRASFHLRWWKFVDGDNNQLLWSWDISGAEKRRFFMCSHTYTSMA